ncbi:MAG TPA: hypothetical protein VI670_05065 [Thermoanaerobaculia bacterium]
MRYSLSLLFCTFLLVPVAHGEEHCQPTDSLLKCMHRFVPALPSDDAKQQQDAAAQTASNMQKDLSTANTGISSLASPSQSSLKDFLSLLSAFAEKGTGQDNATPITLDYNIPIHLVGDEQRLKLQTVLAKPSLSTDLTSRLTGNDTAVSTLKDSLSYADDVILSATLSPSSERFGRSIVPHRQLFQDILVPLFQTNRAANRAVNNFAAALNISSANDRANKPLNEIVTDPMELAKTLADLEASARASALSDANTFAKNFGILLNNQPQFYGSALYHSRKNIAGANEHSAKLTYEIGRHNLNEFFGQHRSCGPGMKTIDAGDCAKALNDFVTSTDAANAKDRVSFAVEYSRSDSTVVTLPDLSVDYTVGAGHKFVYSVAYGRPLSSDSAKDDRLDITINYEDTKLAHATDNVSLGVIRPLDATTTTPPPRDRFVGSITYTYKYNTKMSFPISLVYANHASFFPGDVTRKLNAHFGLVYKLPSGK